MSVDLQWDMLTNSSANLGNALVNAAGSIRQRREQHKDRGALRNYLTNPDSAEAFGELAERNPETAYRIRDEHIAQARQLRADQREHLDYIGQLLRGVTDEAGYQRAIQLARQAGIDVAGHETYDPAFVSAVTELHSRLHPVDPVRVGEGDRLVNPQTGAVVAQGNPQRPRYYSVPPGGRLVPEPGASAAPSETIAVNPQTGERLRLNPATNQWEPIQGGPTPSASGNFPG